MQNIAIGADIGGSHISCAAVDLIKGKVLSKTFAGRPVNNQAKAPEIISVWASCIAEVLGKVDAKAVKGIGFAMPGPFDYVNGISLIRGVAKYENLYGFNIADAIISSLRVAKNFKVRFMNDASSFAVGEAWAGKAKDVKRSVSITLGTGFGSAFIKDKIPVVDGSEVPGLGCLYHLPFKGNIADESFSTRWFVGNYIKATGIELKGVKEIADRASSEKEAMSLFTEFGNNLGVFMAPWINRFKAEKLVIGGNISYAYNLFRNVFEERLKKEESTCKVEISELKEDAGLLGSAYLFEDNFWKTVQHALPLM